MQCLVQQSIKSGEQYLQPSSRGWQIVIHLCHAWWQVLLVPDMILDLRHSCPFGWVWNQYSMEEVSAFLGDLDMRWELVLNLKYPLQSVTP